MKRVFVFLLVALPLLVSCESLQSGKSCTITTPDGKTYRLEKGTRVSSFSGSEFLFKTSGTTLEDSFLLHLNVAGSLEALAISVTKMELAMPLSSNSKDYSSEFSGLIGLSDMTDSEVVFRLKRVRYKLSRGEYVLNGYLTASLTEK